jgi:hypothetical protein
MAVDIPDALLSHENALALLDAADQLQPDQLVMAVR